MARLTANKMIYNKALQLLDSGAAYDDPRWSEVREYVGGSRNGTVKVPAEVQKHRGQYLRYLRQGLTQERIAKHMSLSATMVARDMLWLGLSPYPKATVLMISTTTGEHRYFDSLKSAASQLGLEYQKMTHGQDRIGKWQIVRKQYVFWRNQWHEVEK